MTVARSTLTVALAGNPNSGKTTIFNALTGLRQKVANYPGVTVEKKSGRCKLDTGEWADVIDLPGAYSLISRSPDELVAMEVLRGLRADTPPPDVIVCVLDASNLQRNLYFLSQLIELGRPMVVALNMIDIAERRGIFSDPAALSERLGLPVVPVVGTDRKGINELKAALRRARVPPMPDWPLPEPMHEELLTVAGGLAILDDDALPGLARYTSIAERLLIGDRADDIAALAEREPVKSLLSHATQRLAQNGIDPMHADIEAHYKWIDGVEKASRGSTGFQPVLRHFERNNEEKRNGERENGGKENALETHATLLDYEPRLTFTDKLDRVLLHKVLGLTIFTLVMASIFVSVFWIADPMMGAVEEGIGQAGRFIAGFFPEGPLGDLWADGIVAGVGGVLVFVPQIALLFLFLAILEDSGYLARAAFLMDRVLSKVGLNGKSFIPLLSSFACAIPGIMAARTIECQRDRLATIFVAPFMSCSARLPVYALLIGAFFATFSAAARGGILLGLYALGIIAAVGTAMLFKLGAKRTEPSSFILELPSYKRPKLSQIARVVWTNTWAFISKAGTIIFCLSVILWAMMYYPRLPRESGVALEQQLRAEIAKTQKTYRRPWHVAGSDRPQLDYQPATVVGDGERYPFPPHLRPLFTYNYQPFLDGMSGTEWWRFDSGISPATAISDEQFLDRSVASAQLCHSYAGRLGHLIEPAIKPLGYDWKMGIGLISAFAAREVFVSTMGIVYSVGGDDEDTTPLAQAMLADRYPDGSRVWTPLVATSLLVWFVLAMQCMSTVAIVKRETGGWKWPILQLLYMTGLAYVVSLVVYQVGRACFT